MLLLDTHALIWLASDHSSFSDRVIDELEQQADRLYYSSISLLEMGLLHVKKRVSFQLPPNDMMSKIIAHYGLQEILVDREIAWLSSTLPFIHTDSFDRLLIASAMVHKMIIITKDQTIPLYPSIKTIW